MSVPQTGPGRGGDHSRGHPTKTPQPGEGGPQHRVRQQPCTHPTHTHTHTHNFNPNSPHTPILFPDLPPPCCLLLTTPPRPPQLTPPPSAGCQWGRSGVCRVTGDCISLCQSAALYLSPLLCRSALQGQHHTGSPQLITYRSHGLLFPNTTFTRRACTLSHMERSL